MNFKKLLVTGLLSAVLVNGPAVAAGSDQQPVPGQVNWTNVDSVRNFEFNEAIGFAADQFDKLGIGDDATRTKVLDGLKVINAIRTAIIYIKDGTDARTLGNLEALVNILKGASAESMNSFITSFDKLCKQISAEDITADVGSDSIEDVMKEFKNNFLEVVNYGVVDAEKADFDGGQLSQSKVVAAAIKKGAQTAWAVTSLVDMSDALDALAKVISDAKGVVISFRGKSADDIFDILGETGLRGEITKDNIKMVITLFGDRVNSLQSGKFSKGQEEAAKKEVASGFVDLFYEVRELVKIGFGLEGSKNPFSSVEDVRYSDFANAVVGVLDFGDKIVGVGDIATAMKQSPAVVLDVKALSLVDILANGVSNIETAKTLLQATSRQGLIVAALKDMGLVVDKAECDKLQKQLTEAQQEKAKQATEIAESKKQLDSKETGSVGSDDVKASPTNNISDPLKVTSEKGGESKTKQPTGFRPR